MKEIVIDYFNKNFCIPKTNIMSLYENYQTLYLLVKQKADTKITGQFLYWLKQSYNEVEILQDKKLMINELYLLLTSIYLLSKLKGEDNNQSNIKEFYSRIETYKNFLPKTYLKNLKF